VPVALLRQAQLRSSAPRSRTLRPADHVLHAVLCAIPMLVETARPSPPAPIALAVGEAAVPPISRVLSAEACVERDGPRYLPPPSMFAPRRPSTLTRSSSSFEFEIVCVNNTRIEERSAAIAMALAGMSPPSRAPPGYGPPLRRPNHAGLSPPGPTPSGKTHNRLSRSAVSV